MLLLVGNLHAQTEVLCGMGTPPSQSQTGTPESGAPCFDVDEVFDNCIPIYLRVNIHFFVPDNCEGQAFFADKTEIGQPDEYINQATAYSKAETLINNANTALANNPIQWQTNTGGHCIPFRYVLNGAYMHCSTVGQTQGANFRSALEPFRQNPTSEFTSAPTQCHIDTPPLYVNPNPTDGQIQARFNGIAGNIYDLTATHTLTGTTHRLLDTYLATDGENTITVGTDGMMPGTYVVRVVGDMEIFQTNLVKL